MCTLPRTYSFLETTTQWKFPIPEEAGFGITTTQKGLSVFLLLGGVEAPQGWKPSGMQSGVPVLRAITLRLEATSRPPPRSKLARHVWNLQEPGHERSNSWGTSGFDPQHYTILSAPQGVAQKSK